MRWKLYTLTSGFIYQNTTEELVVVRLLLLQNQFPCCRAVKVRLSFSNYWTPTKFPLVAQASFRGHSSPFKVISSTCLTATFLK